MDRLEEQLWYRLSEDVNVDDLFGFIIENIPYKKVLRLKFLLDASIKGKEELTIKEHEALSKIYSWYKED